MPADVSSSTEYHKRRGVAWDIVDEAIDDYESWMLDDDYDAMRVLHRIMDRMIERRRLYQSTPTPSSPMQGEEP